MHPFARRHFEKVLREGDRTPVEARCLIKVHPTAGSTRDGRIMRRLSQLLIELHGGSQRAA